MRMALAGRPLALQVVQSNRPSASGHTHGWLVLLSEVGPGRPIRDCSRCSIGKSGRALLDRGPTWTALRGGPHWLLVGCSIGKYGIVCIRRHLPTSIAAA